MFSSNVEDLFEKLFRQEPPMLAHEVKTNVSYFGKM